MIPLLIERPERETKVSLKTQGINGKSSLNGDASGDAFFPRSLFIILSVTYTCAQRNPNTPPLGQIGKSKTFRTGEPGRR